MTSSLRASHWCVTPMLGVAVVLSVTSSAHAQQTLTRDVVTDPDLAEFVFQDVTNFLTAMAAIEAGEDTTIALRRDYFDAGTPGLQIYVEKYDLTPERLIRGMRKYPADYARVAEVLQALESSIPSFRQTYHDLKEAIPHAVFPPTYFLVGGHRGIGSGSVEGPLLSVEKEDPAKLQVGLPPTLVHEMIHMQQLAALGPEYFSIFSGPEQTLLATSIREGVATFFTELIAGGSEHKNQAREFLLAHEARLWRDFEREMLGNEMGDWLWHEPADPAQPQDVGYAIGARIAESYYERAEDKAAAVRAILSVTDYPSFLRKSGYADRF